MFSSERKMMSVLVRRESDQEYIVYTKGADSSVLPRVVSGITNLDRLQKKILRLEKLGQRVICFAERNLIPEEKEEIDLLLRTNHVDNLEKVMRDKYESKLVFLGLTGLQESLIPSVPETIKTLSEAGIRTWVLTGDSV